jgi:hypothetical protein
MPLLAGSHREIDGRYTMRSVVDALAQLHEVGDLRDGEQVGILTMPVRLPDGTYSGVMSVVAPPPPSPPKSIVLMPASSGFTARTPLGTPVTYTIDVLDNAVSDAEGNVTLANGQCVHHVQLKLASFYEFSETDDAVVRLTIRFLGLEDRCSRALDADFLPGCTALDYALVRGIEIKRFKPVVQYVLRHRPHLSASAVALALRRAGMTLPRSVR